MVDTALQPLVDKRDRLLAESVGDQRKVVTVLFADLVDSTPLARRLDPEDLQQVMSRYFAALRTAIQAEGGVVEKFIGGRSVDIGPLAAGTLITILPIVVLYVVLQRQVTQGFLTGAVKG